MATSSTVLRGRVIRLDPDGRPYVEVPSLGQGYVIGPLEVATPSVVVVGARVVVASLSAVSEDLVVVGVIGAEAIGGGGTVVSTFAFPDPVSSWPLPHGFGAMPASIVLVDAAGSELVGEVDHDVALELATVTWGVPTAGSAYVFAGGAGPKGSTGATGKSAYQLAVDQGFVGSLAQWLASLEGDPGTPGAPGNPGTPGKSAYELAVINGFAGTEAEWLASLAGVVNNPHGTDPNVARLPGVINHWIGTATPVNAIATDWWTRKDIP